MTKWRELMQILEQVNLKEGGYQIVWDLEKSGKFTTKSLYRLITHREEVDLRIQRLWEKKLPLKMKIFLWMLWHDRVQTGEQLKK